MSSNHSDSVLQTTQHITNAALQQNGTQSEPILVLDENRNGYWSVADRDVPILIGAAAGAVGLVGLILGAMVIWYCCQFALKRGKSIYSLDNEESERGSVSSHGSNTLNSESVVFMGGKSMESEANNNGAAVIKRSISAPLNGLIQATGDSGKVAREGKPFSNIAQYTYSQYSDMPRDAESEGEASEKSHPKGGVKRESLSSSRCHLYSAAENEDAVNLKTRSLPWKRSPIQTEESDDLGDLSPKVNFSKKRKNRMRNDSAAAIALNRSGAGPSPARMPFVHKDTDSLVDNEAVVVYDERTAL